MNRWFLIGILLLSGSFLYGQIALPGPHVIQVEVDTFHGYFGIGHLDGRRLNFDYWHPWVGRQASHFVLNIDGSLYTNVNWLTSCPATLLDPFIIGTRIVGTSIVTTWRIPVGGDQIELRQIFTPQMLYISPTESLETVRIQYSITNLGTSAHIVGLLLNIDVVINARDDAPMAVGRVYSDVGAMYTYPLIPSYYQAFELSVRQGPTYLVARGYLTGFGATSPDVFAFGRQSVLTSVCWDDAQIAGVVGVRYSDSGVLMRWNPRMIQPGQVRNIITYYGFGSTSGAGGFCVTNQVVIPPEGRNCMLANNPFEVTAMVTNALTPPIILQGCSLCVRSLPSILSVPSPCIPLTPSTIYPESVGIGTFNILVDTTRVRRDTTVSITLCPTTITPGIDECCTTFTVTIPFVSGILPTAEVVPPANIIVSCSTGSVIPFRFIVRDNEGVDTLSPRINFNGTTYDIHDGVFYYEGYQDTVVQIVFPPFDTVMVNGETLRFTLTDVSDKYGCEILSPVSGYFVVDRRGPYARDFSPRNDTFITDRRQAIRVRIIDVLAGVNLSSIQVTVHDRGGDANYSWGSTQLFYFGDTLVFLPPRDYYDNDTVIFCILQANDRAQICGANHFEGEVSCVRFFTDFSGPTVIFSRPQNNQAVSCVRESVFVYLRDINGIDSMSIQVVVNGINYRITDPNLYFRPDSNIIVFYPLTPFADGDLVSFSLISVRDGLGNDISSPVEINFRVDLTGPYAANPDPPDWSIINSSTPNVRMEVLDDIAGVNPSTIRVRVRIAGAEREFDYGSSVVQYSAGILTVRVGETGMTASHGDTITVCLVDVEDLAMYCGANRLRDTLCVHLRLDLQGPIATLLNPQNNAVTSCSLQNIVIHLDDDASIDTNTILVVVNYDTFSISSAELSYNPATRNITLVPSLPFPHSTRVYVHLISASDSLGNRLYGGPYEWFFTVDRQGPRVLWSAPANGSSVSSPHPNFFFLVQDSLNGITRSSPLVSFFIYHPLGGIDTIRLSWDTGSMSWSGDTLIVSTASISFMDGDSVNICLDEIADSALYCGPNYTRTPYCFYVIASFSGPSVTPVAPLNNSYVSCDSPAIIVRIIDRDGIQPMTISMRVQGVNYQMGVYPWMTYDGQNLRFYPRWRFSNGETVYVSVDSVRDGLGNPILEPVQWRFVVDITPPVITDFYPSPGSFISDPHPTISFVAFDSISGVSRSSLVFVVNGDTFAFPRDTSVEWIGDTATLSTREAGLSFEGGDTVRVCVYVTDRAFICPPDTLTQRPNFAAQCWSFTISAEGPQARVIYPLSNSSVSCAQVDTIIFYLYDPDGVVPTSIRVDINGDTVSYPNVQLVFRDTILYVIPAVPYSAEGEYYVSLLSASDPVGNRLSGAPILIRFRVDHSSPVLFSPSPTEGSTIYVPSPLIEISAVDTYGVVDPSSFVVRIFDGTNIWVLHYGDVGVGWDGVRFIVNTALAGISFTGGTTVEVCVDSVADSARYCGVNRIGEPFCWRFDVSSIGPMVRLISPVDSLAFGAGCIPPYSFRFVLAGPQPVDTSSVLFMVVTQNGRDTNFVDLSSPDLHYSNDTLYYTHSALFPDCDTIIMSVARANDILGNPVAENRFIFISDRVPPQVVRTIPANNASVYVPDPVIDIVLFDNCTFLDTASYELVIIASRIDTFRYPNSCVAFVGDTLRFSSSCAGYWFRRDQLVEVCLNRIADNTDTCINVLSEPYCFDFIVSQGGPIARIVSPVVGEFICDNTPITIYLSDEDGVDDSSIVLLVGGRIYTVDSTELSFIDDSLLIFVPSEPYEVETLEVVLLAANDMLGYGLDSTFQWHFRIDQKGPQFSYVGPIPADSVVSNWPDIQIRITDDYHTVDSTTIELLVNRRIYHISPETLVWDRFNNLLTFSTFASGDTFFSNDTIVVCLNSAYDSTGCPEQNQLQGAPVCTTLIIAPGIGPITRLLLPSSDGIYISCDSSTFTVIAAIVSPNGVAETSIVVEVRVSDTIDTLINTRDPVERIRYNRRDTLIIHPGIVMEDGDIVRITILDAVDRLGTPISEPVTWNFFVDRSSPVVVSTIPSDGEVVGVAYPLVRLVVRDRGAGVDTSTISVRIGTTTLSWGNPSLAYISDTIFIDFERAGISVVAGETTRICLETLGDRVLYCTPNFMPEPYCFSIVGATGSIVAYPVEPLNLTVTTCNDQTIRIFIESEYGIIPSSIQLMVNGVVYAYPDPHLLLNNDTLIFVPSVPYDEGIVNVNLISVEDSLHNRLSLPCSFSFIVDLTPPILPEHYPIHGSSTLDWQQDIGGKLYDEFSLVDLEMCTLYINGVPFPFDYSLSDSTFLFNTRRAGLIFEEFSRIEIQLHVADNPTYCNPNETTYSWYFTIADDDTVGPEIVLAEACSVRAESPFRLMAHLFDPSGIYDDSTDISGQGIFLVWDTSAVVDFVSGRYAGIVQMDLLDSITAISGFLPPLREGILFTYQVVAYDNDFDFNNPVDRARAVSVSGSCVITNIIPPLAFILEPFDGSFSSCECQPVIVALYDENGIALDSLILDVNGVRYSWGSLRLSSSVSRDTVYVRFVPEPCFDYGETVYVELVRISDLLGNVATNVLNWRFIIDTRGPIAEILTPTEGDILDPEEFTEIRIRITDELSGVDPASIRLRINGGTYSIASSGVRFVDNELVVDIRAAGLSFERGDTVRIALMEAFDSPDYCEPNPLREVQSVWVMIKPLTGCKAAPKPFTPNQDGFNDLAYFDYPGRYDKEAVIRIYDLDNKLVRTIRRNGFDYIWDGKDENGKDCRQGAYIYVIEVEGKKICSGLIVIAR